MSRSTISKNDVPFNIWIEYSKKVHFILLFKSKKIKLNYILDIIL